MRYTCTRPLPSQLCCCSVPPGCHPCCLGHLTVRLLQLHHPVGVPRVPPLHSPTPGPSHQIASPAGRCCRPCSLLDRQQFPERALQFPQSFQFGHKSSSDALPLPRQPLSYLDLFVLSPLNQPPVSCLPQSSAHPVSGPAAAQRHL